MEKIDVGRYFVATFWSGVPLIRILKQWDAAQERIQTLEIDEYCAIQKLGLYFWVYRRKGARLSEIANEFLKLLL